MEWWDLIAGERQPLNRLHRRGEPMLAGEYHVVAGIWTVNSKGDILLTLRHAAKPDYPGKWENTCGSVLAGESSREGAVRELAEETGIVAQAEELVLLGTRKETHAFVDTYFLHKDVALSELTLQDGETAAACWVNAAELDGRIADQSLAAPVADRLAPLRRLFEQHRTRVTATSGS